jgi:membrane protein DedA with SNARE-associated domain
MPLFRLPIRAVTSLPLATLISLSTLEQVLGVVGYPAVVFFVMIESMGVPFPGETMLLLASFYAAVNGQLQIVPVIACAALGAILGDNIGYTIGRTGGRAFVQRFGRYLFLKPQYLDKAEQFFAHHGAKTVFFGRFITLLRMWSAFLAGVNHMHWRTFLLCNGAGGIVWAIAYGTLGYIAGRIFHDNFAQIEHIASTISWTVGGLIVAVVLVALFLLWQRARKHKAANAQQTPAASDAEPTQDSVSTPRT